jgi:tryptophan-rich sensory protein
VLYLSSAYAAARIAPMEGSAYGMAFWAMQIAFNTLWTPIFFGLHRIKAAFFVMIGLWTAVAGTMVSFFMLDWIAGALFVPYLIWVTVAGALNASVWARNPNEAAVAAE